jgi:ubiquinone/menaquinone biosynthesis C-methylase UbiE
MFSRGLGCHFGIDASIMFDQSWEQIFSEREWGKYPPEHVIRFVARNWYRVPDRSAVRLLDVGCGPGACSWYMAREGFSVSGIDGSPSGIRQARERLAREGLHAEFKVGDFCRPLPWPDASFDGAIDNVAICYAQGYWANVIREVRRVLKPAGRFHSVWFGTRLTKPVEGRARYVTEAELRTLFSSVFVNIVVDTHLYTEGEYTVELLMAQAW